MNEDGLPPGAEPGYELPELHRSTRMPLDAVVRLHFEGTVAYQNGFAANVSAKGMFVKHPDPPPVGTKLVFEFVLGGQRKPVQGAGVVSWRREKYEGPGKAAGVGIEFTEMDALSRQHVAEAIFEYLEAQLGVELGDHPDVQNLVDSVPSSTPVDLTPAAPSAGPLFEPEPESPPVADASATPALPFRVFGDTPAEEAVEPEAHADLFRPEIPPEDPDFLQAYGAARRKSTSPWAAAAIFLLVVAGGFAAWWFLLGPGSAAARKTTTAAVTPESAPPAAPVRPPLSPQQGPDGTLAEAVGATAAPAPPDAGAGEPAAVAADEVDPAAPTVAEAADAPAPGADRSAGPEARAEGAPTPEPPPAAASSPATRLQQITWSRLTGATEVRLVGDGAFAAGRFRWYAMNGGSPRVLIKLLGMAAPFGKSALPASTPELTGVRVGYHAQAGGNEIHVVLDLASADVQVAGVEPRGDQLVVRLESR